MRMVHMQRFEMLSKINIDLIEQLIENTFREKIGVTPVAPESSALTNSFLGDLFLMKQEFFSKRYCILRKDMI